MRRNKILLLVASLAALALLLVAAWQEHVAKEWRRLQQRVSASSASSPTPIQLRQVVVPALAVTDRCVTCHLGMAPGETPRAGDRALAPHPPVVHDPAQFGCTTCHGGQGRATEAAAAHGEVPFWPKPMLAAKYAQAGCGACHSHLEVASLAELRRGQQLLERYDCLACHALDGRGGTERPGAAAGVTAPNLSLVGQRGWRRDWYEEHLSRRGRPNAPAWVSSFGAIPAPERRAIEVLLASRVGAPRLVEAKALFHSLGCRGCHKVNGVGGDDGPDLTHVGEKDPGQLNWSHVQGPRRLDAWFKEHFRDPAGVVPGSLMPALASSDEELDLLTLYVLSLRRTEVAEAYWPNDRIRAMRFGASEFARDPATLYGTFCAACHGRSGEGMRFAGMAPFPAIASPGFLALASDAFIAEAIRHGRPGRRMAAWSTLGLSEPEIAALAAQVRQLGGGVPAERSDDHAARLAGDAGRGKALYARLCARCHGARGEGGEGTSLANPVLLASATDFYLAETVRRGRAGTSMEGFGQPSVVRPVLTSEEIADLVVHLRSWERAR